MVLVSLHKKLSSGPELSQLQIEIEGNDLLTSSITGRLLLIFPVCGCRGEGR
jgi:hypothetical protein